MPRRIFANISKTSKMTIENQDVGARLVVPAKSRTAKSQTFARRTLFAALAAISILLPGAMLISILRVKGSDVVEALMVAAFLVNMTSVVLVFWNSVFGFVLRRGFAGRSAGTWPPSGQGHDGAPIVRRTAVVMTVRNEDPAGVFARIRSVKASLDRTGFGQFFDYFVLSDSSRTEIMAAEERAFAAWCAEIPEEGRVFYRRRASNIGFKPGNLREFCVRWGQGYEFLLLLDADSLMTGATILRHIRLMQDNPRLGILQSLVVGVLSPSIFARIFEFGHRHALRCAIAGAAWWQDDRCQFWGHNATIRLAPFMAYCELPHLPGKGPFGGHVIAHDQIEASLMHRAGYEVRVLPEESGSYEGVPPTLLDFLKRNHRWFQGNLKNLKVARLPGLPAIDRFHLTVVAQRFLSWPAMVVFVALAAFMASSWPSGTAFPTALAIALYAIWMVLFLAPKLLGVLDALLTSPSGYGGGARLLLGSFVEVVFAFLLVPVAMVATTGFMFAMAFGRGSGWEAQRRDRNRLSWKAAFAALCPQTVLGLAMLFYLAATNAGAIPWFCPFLLGLLLAVPFAILTSLPSVDALADRLKLCIIPEEVEVPAEILDVVRAASLPR
ncbi:MAG: glucans biosynthesis glucosyltransferase MdoH [Hyphomicrobiales bacterium]